MVQHNTGQTTPTICVHELFIVDHCIRLRNTMAIVKDRSHINQTLSITQVYFFLINSIDQELNRPSRFRVYVFLLDIFSRAICSFIYYVKFYHSRACNTCKAEAVKPWLRTCCRMCNIKQDFEEKTKKYVTCDTPANPRLFLNSFDPSYFVPTYDQLAISDLHTQTIMIEFTFPVHD